ncbi:hypothetical protein [Pandoraea oxalativorans]|uniref:hypothetical protein n=1 Tax=Pandoraea oxalativorans TaxID=573737 RepID=UPI0012F4AF39|nr:hypothetical protein [Pandoraea oxalativorans]
MSRPWLPTGALDRALNHQVSFNELSHAGVCEGIDRHFFSSLGATAAPIRLRVNEVWTDAAHGAGALNTPPRTGSELLEQVTATISAAFVDAGVPGNIAHVQAFVIASQLACEEFLNVDRLLSVPNVEQIVYQQVLDVSVRGTEVCFHKTTTYKAKGGETLTQVVDLGTKIWTERSYLGYGDTWRLHAQVTNAAVRLSGALERDVLLGSDERVTSAARHFKVPRAPNGFWGCLTQVFSRLAGLLGKRGIEVVVGNAENLADVKAVTRPGQLELTYLDEDFDRSALLVCAAQDYGWWNNGVAEYRSVDDQVMRGDYLLDDELQFKAYIANGNAKADRHASLLLAAKKLTVGDDLRGGGRFALASHTNRYAGEYLTRAALAAEAQATLLKDLEDALGGDLFRYSMTNHDFITLGAENILARHDAALLEYAQLLCRLERAQTAEGLAPAAELPELRRRVDALARAHDLSGLSEPEQIMQVKKRLVKAVIKRIEEAFRDDPGGAFQVLTTLAYAEKASQHVVIQGDGGPQFLNGHDETRQISIFIRNPARPNVAGQAFIKFCSSVNTLGERGEIRFGRSTLAKDRFHEAKMASVSFWRVEDNEEPTLVNAWYYATFELNVPVTPPLDPSPV